MQAVEFTTTITNGTITVPEKEKLPSHQTVKVIVLFDELKEDLDSKQSEYEFRATSIKTKGFKFDREEAHER